MTSTPNTSSLATPPKGMALATWGDRQEIVRQLDARPVSAFSHNLAFWLGYLSLHAYDDDIGAKIGRDLGFDDVKTVDSAKKTIGPYVVDTQGLLLANKDCVIVAFRGTEPEDYKDWLTDLAYLWGHHIPSKNQNVWVHTGFYEATISVIDDINAFVKRYPNLPIYITGHSLGGALAAVLQTIWALDDNYALDSKHRTANAVYTFGQPRIGGATLQPVLEKATPGGYYRVVNTSDPVPSVPPDWLGYRHAGILRNLWKRDSKYPYVGHYRVNYVSHMLDDFPELLLPPPSLVKKPSVVPSKVSGQMACRL